MNVPLIRPMFDTSAAASSREDVCLARARDCAEAAFARASELDFDGAFPDVEFAQLQHVGLLAAPLARAFGGLGLGLESASAQLTVDVLSTIGWGSLPLGRLYEGHVNALRLIQTHGTARQIADYARDVAEGALFGVWNTQGAEGLSLEAEGADFRLRGAKIFASGAGRVTRPLVTARRPDGGVVMVVPRLDDEILAARTDLSGWRAQGMRASASGAFDFTGLAVKASDIIGAPEDYHLQPAFSAGAWRFCAVQLGGIERLLDVLRSHLAATARGGDPYQIARVGEVATAAQGARLWVEAAARRAEATTHDDPQALIAFVNLTRGAVERAGLEAMELTQRSIGLQGFLRTHPVERVLRDLSTYLRQPAPDKALSDAAAHVLASGFAAHDLWRR